MTLAPVPMTRGGGKAGAGKPEWSHCLLGEGRGGWGWGGSHGDWDGRDHIEHFLMDPMSGVIERKVKDNAKI